MPDKALDVYLNDHLAGALLGSQLAGQIRDQSEGSSLGDVMAPIAREIDADRQTLTDLVEQLGTSRNPVKEVTGWLAEKVSRAKFAGATSGDPDFGLFMALETLTLGVEGKLSLWRALKEIAGEHAPLAAADLDGLISRAQSQHQVLERERVAAGRRALGQAGASSDGAP